MKFKKKSMCFDSQESLILTEKKGLYKGDAAGVGDVSRGQTQSLWALKG